MRSMLGLGVQTPHSRRAAPPDPPLGGVTTMHYGDATFADELRRDRRGPLSDSREQARLDGLVQFYGGDTR